MKMTRDFYIREGSRKIASKESTAIAYLYEVAGREYAMGFHGKIAKPSFHYSFKTADNREKHVTRFFEEVKKSEVYHAEQKAKQKIARATPHNWEPGLILQCSWGYDQTNVDFFEVTRVISPTMVEIEQIGSYEANDNDLGRTSMSSYVVPNPKARTGKITRHKVVNASIKSPIYGNAYVWKGRPAYSSSYA